MRLDDVYNKIKKLNKELEEARETAKEMEKELIAGVEETKKGSSTILSANGKSISITARNSRHYERKVYWYDGNKRTSLIADSDRGSIRDWKLWLARW